MAAVLEKEPVLEASLPKEVELRLKRLLVIVDGSAQTSRVLDYVIRHAVTGAPVEAILLCIQPAPQGPGIVPHPAAGSELDLPEPVGPCAKRIIRSAARRLAHLGIVHRERVETGDPAATIVRCAAEEQCDLIVLAEPEPGPADRLARRVGVATDSLFQRVAREAAMPVVIAK